MQPRISSIGGDGPPAPLPDLIETQASPPGLPSVPEAIDGKSSPGRRGQLDRQVDVPEGILPRSLALEGQLMRRPAWYLVHIMVSWTGGVRIDTAIAPI